VTVEFRVPRAESGQQPADPFGEVDRDEHDDPPFDPVQYWVAAHTSGLTSVQIRIIDCMIGRAGARDLVALSMAKIGIGAASSKVDIDLRTLISGGWLKNLPKLPPDERKLWKPKRYQLTLPSQPARIWSPCPGADPAMAAPAWLRERDRHTWSNEQWRPRSWRRCLGGHDAFRRAKGTLSAAYPVLTLLTGSPTSTEVLATLLGAPERRVKDLADQLVRAGVVNVTAAGFTRAPGDLTRLLDDVALEADRLGLRKPGKPTISGTRDRAIQDLQERFEDWLAHQQTWLEDRAVPGTETWRKIQAKEFKAILNSPSGAPLRQAWAETGRSQEELVDEVVDDYLCQFEQSRVVMGAWLNQHVA
jgi:hypothetical protein